VAWERTSPQYIGSLNIVLPAATFTGKALSTTYTVFWNTASSTYPLLTTTTAPSDSYVYIGTVTTVGSSGTGGATGGGGRYLA
jgi:hypothetical protein